jgi:hypothetical protein
MEQVRLDRKNSDLGGKVRLGRKNSDLNGESQVCAGDPSLSLVGYSRLDLGLKMSGLRFKKLDLRVKIRLDSSQSGSR